MSEFGTSASGQEAAERRFLTIEFIDLVGFTDLAEKLDPEDLGVLLRRYQRLALTVMERFGGFVAQVFGDGILAYFGYPTAHGNDAERALHAALALHQALSSLDTNVHGSKLTKLEARIGVHSGLVLIAHEQLMSAGASRHGVVGEAVNLSARLQAEARPGGVAVSQETQDLVEGLFEFKSLGAKSIKGLSRKVSVYEVVRALPDSVRSGARIRRGAGRMVGREAEIERILSRWNAVRNGPRCQTVAVVADAGVGKTRLVLELSSRPEFADAAVLQMQCLEMFSSTPLYPLAVFLRARAGLTAEDEEPARRAKISGYLDEIGRNSEENRDLVAGILRVAAPAANDAEAATPQLLKRKQ